MWCVCVCVCVCVCTLVYVFFLACVCACVCVRLYMCVFERVRVRVRVLNVVCSARASGFTCVFNISTTGLARTLRFELARCDTFLGLRV